MVSGLFGPAEGALGAESILGTSQHKDDRRSTIDGCGYTVELGAQDFLYDSRPDGLMRGIARLLPIGGALLIFSEYNVRLTIGYVGIYRT